MARFFILLGIVLILIGVFWDVAARIGLGRLPGDIVIERPGFRLFIPITSALVVSVVLSAGLALLRMLWGR